MTIPTTLATLAAEIRALPLPSHGRGQPVENAENYLHGFNLGREAAAALVEKAGAGDDFVRGNWTGGDYGGDDRIDAAPPPEPPPGEHDKPLLAEELIPKFPSPGSATEDTVFVYLCERVGHYRDAAAAAESQVRGLTVERDALRKHLERYVESSTISDHLSSARAAKAAGQGTESDKR